MLATCLFSLALLSTTTYGAVSRANYYANWMGTMADNTGATAFNGDISTLRLIDIVIPGSHHAGMYPAGIISSGYATSTDSYYDDVLAWTTGNLPRAEWAKRQRGSVKAQLNAGSRFLDIRLETKGGETRAHNGLLGAELSTMLADIKSFLDASDGGDIIILSFNNFINVAANTVLNTVLTELSDYVDLKANYDVRSDTISELLTADVKVIPVFDDLASLTTAAPSIHNASVLFSGSEGATPIGLTAISNTIGGLVDGWDTSDANGEFNLIYYVLNIATSSEKTKYSNTYASYAEYTSSDLMISLTSTIRKYPKLYFGNALIVDFVEASSVVDEVISLNYNYLGCRDPVENWGDVISCPTLVGLSGSYKTEGVTDACTITTSLATTCPRSCGACSWISGVPGSACDATTNTCDSGIYTAATGAEGECFERDDDWENFIKDPAFCLSPFSSTECGTKSSDLCAGDAAVDVGCSSFCSADYQCASGYCDGSSSVCLVIATPTTTAEGAEETECYCPRVESSVAIEWRDSIEGFRPGDPNGPYEIVMGTCTSPGECNELLDENLYIKSLIGFIMIPFTLAIIMFIMYFFCCSCWCCCTKYWKKKCCKCCLGDTDESIPGRWIPTVIMLVILIVLIWAGMEGVTANEKMHDHVFAETGSLRYEMIDLFDVAIEKFSGIKPEAQWIVDNIKAVFGSVTGILDGVDAGTAVHVSAIYSALNNIVKNYDGFSIVTNVSTPFAPIQKQLIDLPCDYCAGLGDQIGGINDTFSSAVSIIDSLQSMLNSTGGLMDAEAMIDDSVSMFNTMVDDFVAMLEQYKEDAQSALDGIEPMDVQREQALSAFLMLPIVWVLFWVLAIVLALPFLRHNKACKCIGECCFKITWCTAMWIGAVIMLVFSFFAVISVGWADLCYNLDMFEADPEGSNLGQTIASFTNGSEMNPITIVNACWTGADLIKALGMADSIDFSAYQKNMTSALNVDVTNSLTIDAVDSFVSEINLLNTDEFKVQGDNQIAVLNAVGGVCTCVCSASHGTPAAAFTRDKIVGDQCHNVTAQAPRDCWLDQSLIGLGTTPAEITANAEKAQLQLAHCIGNFTLAYTFLQAEVVLTSETQGAIDYIKNETAKILNAYDGIFGVAVNIENSVKNISCSIEPIFERMKTLLADYSTCGFIGEAYGGFKNVGCELLFEDMYYISKAMMIIAFLSPWAVIFGFMSEYSWHPVKDDDEEDDAGMKLMKSASQRFGFGGSDNEEAMADEVELGTKPPPPDDDAPPGFDGPGAAEGGGAAAATSDGAPEGGGDAVNQTEAVEVVTTTEAANTTEMGDLEQVTSASPEATEEVSVSVSVEEEDNPSAPPDEDSVSVEEAEAEAEA
eukprot:278789_1